ncbi:VOC family protein [Arenimonas oryziterrae]|uniref:VOC domain-containing protein n=1 Tax=Arenimonas oryziterrae DSM 21050 = YC6267 TaxID=1121015 RepID=A0A091AV43_9GAMM|nr:VOC family protein [Arenimonas oryziterrae]KFN42519.1 hypothetical protein N789_12835 [Arenimonas oryziterrae DSM 21050 = YC6267]
MTRTYTPPVGTPGWFELATTDQDGARRFYAGLFGWTPEETPLPDGSSYTVFKHGGRDVAACYTMMADQRAQGVPVHWGVYFRVEDCDAAVASVLAAGGKLLAEPFEVMGLLRMAVVSDPEGAVFCLSQPRTHPGVGVFRDPDAMLWVELSTRDIRRAESFYGTIFPWTFSDHDGAPEVYRVFSVAGEGYGGLLQMDEQWAGIPTHWSVYVHATDIDAKVAQALALGGSIVVPVFRAPGVGRIALLADPSGGKFYLIEPTEMG